MRDVGPLIGLIVFIVLTAVFGFFAFDAYGKITGPDPRNEQGNGSTHYDAKLRDVQVAIEQIESELKTKRQDIANKRDQIDRLLARQYYAQHLTNGQDGLLEQAYNGRRVLTQSAEQMIKDAGELRGKLTEAKGNVKNTLRTEDSNLRTETDGEIGKLQEQKEASIRRVAADKQAIDRDEKEYRQQRNYQQSTLDESKRQLDYLTSREPERADVQSTPDGEVIEADVVHNTIVINRGTAQGVKNGYRFEVFQLKPGNKKLSKGFIEVRRATVNVSECLILTKPVDMPRDPLSDYVAAQPEEQFSPYQESGRAGSMLQGLSAVPKKTTMGMDVMVPIVVGDYIQNPFFSPDKTFVFYLAGDKTIVQGQQKSAIAYQWPHIKRVIEGYGGKVLDKVDLSVNYMIVQKNPQDDPQYNQGVTYGIPVMHEWELFRFLDQQ
jgi:hypothetical protein